MYDNINKKKYSYIAKSWHWGFVLLFVYGVAKQVDEIEQLEDKFFFQLEFIIFRSPKPNFKLVIIFTN